MADSSKERAKTWGFRRTTIARREFLEEVGELIQESKPVTPRRGGRQPRGRGRARQAAGTNPTPTSKRGRGSRKSALNSTHGSASTETTTEANSEAACLQPLETSESEGVKKVPPEKQSQSEGTTDSEDISLQEYAERLKRRKQLEDKKAAVKAEQEAKSKTNGAKREIIEIETSTEEEDVVVRQTGKPQTARTLGNAGSSQSSCANTRDDTLAKRSQRPTRGMRKSASRFPDTEEDEEESKEDEAEAEEPPVGCESEDTDPDAVYCLCRQKHNKRFMICCDRCQEWFHGDCVGISEKRGRLMEKNEEDYICPNCSPCPSPAPLQTVQATLSTTGMSSVSESGMVPSTCEDKPSEDAGIKGKIRKASSEGTKKKIKIFQPGMVTAMVVKEEQTLSKCIGPGCTKSALPDSVYCGHDCILRHAAVAMKSLSEQQTPKPEPSPEVNPTPKPLSKPTLLSALKAQMKPLLGKVARKKSSGVEVEDQGANKEKEAAVLPSTQSEAVRSQQSSSIVSSVFYKSNTNSTLNIDSKTERDDLGKSKSPSEVNPCHTVPSPPSKTVETDFNLLPLNSKPAVPSVSHSNMTASKQQSRAAPTVSNILPLLPKKSPEQSPPSTSPSSPTPSCAPVMVSKSQQNSKPAVLPVSDSEASRNQPTTAPNVDKVLPPLPKKSPEPSPPSTSSPSPSCSPVMAMSQQGPQAPQMPSEQKPKPSIQIRINVRRSLTDVLWKRVNDNDDITLPEGEVGNLAVNIEKAVYNMYNSTDSKYKNKYRLIMFNLKDPQNKVLFYRVIKGEISPSKLTRLSPDELQARDSSSPNISEPPAAHQSCSEIGQVKKDLKEEPSVSVAVEKTTQLSRVAACKSEDSLSTPSQDSGIKQNQPVKMSVAVPDIISSMLKDTTSEHKTHLFDLKCRICTGQISADDDERASKRLKKSEPEEKTEKQETSHKEKLSKMSRGAERRTAPIVPRAKSPVMESPASPVPEDTTDTGEESSDFTPIVIPEVSIVSVTRQDPRTAAFRPAVKPKLYQPVTPSPPITPVISEPKPVKPPPPPPPAVPKSILTKPTGSSVRIYSTSRPTTSVVSTKPPPDQDTRHFLLRQETIWKGFLNMQTVAKFVTKGYLVSGSSKYLNEDIPDTIHIGGRILPQTVWEYVDRVKTSPSKDLCLIRFQPATDEEEVAYVSLFSYFNSRRRFGVVSNHCTYIKDFYLIPLGAHESLPSQLLPLEGPGFECNRPNLLLGLAVCQKPKPTEVLKEVDETRLKANITSESSDGGFHPAKTVTASEKPYDCQPYDPAIPICATPPGSPDSSSSGSVSSPSDLAQSVLSIIKAPTAASSKPITDSTPPASTDKNPLRTILKTLFGKKEEPLGNTVDSTKQSPSVDTKPSVPYISEVDVIVQKYRSSSTVAPIDDSDMKKDDDRPYDPEEEYDAEVEYGILNQTSTISLKNEAHNDDDRPYDPEEYDPAIGYDGPMNPVKTFDDKAVAQQSAIEDDVAYDPEDSTFFEEMQADLAGSSGGTEVLSEHQKMLLELNKQIEEQKRQLEEQEEALSRQRAAAGMSMAHFSVSDALLSPPRTSYLSQCDLLQLAEKQDMDTVVTESTVKPIINQRRDPRKKREVRCVESNPVDSEHDNKHTPSGSLKSETIPPEKPSITTDIQTSKQDTPVSSKNKTSTEKNTEKKQTDKSDVKELTKKGTHAKARNLKTEPTEKSDDARHHSHHHRSRHESRRTSRGDSRDLSPRKRRRSGDNREMKPSQTSSVIICENDKRHEREQFEHRATNISFSRQTGREHQRKEGPKEFEPISEGAQKGSFHSKPEEPAPENRFRDRGPCQNSTPRGPPSRMFSDSDCQTPHNFDRPFNSNQYDGPCPSMHRPGQRGPFGRPPNGPFENRGPRPPRSGPPGPPFRQFNVGSGPRMSNVDGPWRSNNNNDFDDFHPFHDIDRSVPPHMFRENHGDFSFSGPPTEQPEMHGGGDLEWGMQRPHFVPNRFDEQCRHDTPEGTGPEFCGSGPSENFRNREIVNHRRASCPDPPDRSLDPRASHHLDHHGPSDCPPFSRPRGHTSRTFLENKGHPGLCLDKPDNQSDAPPRRHSGPLLPTPPGGPIGLFNPTIQRPPQGPENPWPTQNPAGRRGGFERETSGSDNTRTGPEHFEEGYQQNPSMNKDPSNEHIREQSEERISDGGMPRQRDRKPWPREQGWKRDLSGERGDIEECEGETRRPRDGRDRDYDRVDAKRARIRDRDRDSHSSCQEDRNQLFHERTRGRGQKGGRFKGFGRKRSRGRERSRERF